MIEVRKPAREYKVWKSLVDQQPEEDDSEAESAGETIDATFVETTPTEAPQRPPRAHRAGIAAVRLLAARHAGWAIVWSVITAFFGTLSWLALTHHNGWLTLVPFALTLWCGRFAVYYAIATYGVLSFRPR